MRPVPVACGDGLVMFCLFAFVLAGIPDHRAQDDSAGLSESKKWCLVVPGSATDADLNYVASARRDLFVLRFVFFITADTNLPSLLFT